MIVTAVRTPYMYLYASSSSMQSRNGVNDHLVVL